MLDYHLSIFVIWLCVDLKDRSHLHIRVIVILSHLSKTDSSLEITNTCLMSFKCLRVKAELYLTNKLIEKKQYLNSTISKKYKCIGSTKI